MVEITVVEQNKEKRMKINEDSLRDLWDNIKCNNICIIVVPEGGERELYSKDLDVNENTFRKYLRVYDVVCSQYNRKIK